MILSAGADALALNLFKKRTPFKMALTPKKKTETIKSLSKQLKELTERVAALEPRPKTPPGKSIHNIEEFNGETATPTVTASSIHMNYKDRIQSMRNLIVVLNPNLIVDGRHLPENVQAICGFEVTAAMMDEAYEEG